MYAEIDSDSEEEEDEDDDDEESGKLFFGLAQRFRYGYTPRSGRLVLSIAVCM